MNILELGAGSGRYSHYFARKGYKVDAVDDETFDLYLRYHLTVCERCDLVGASNHTLDIFRKERFNL